ncbi:MAG TPA: class I SAM-dependent methyltransferase, partial [Candidatus Eisenbacteria bacterium]
MSDSRGRIIGHYASMPDGYRDWWAPVLDSMAAPALDALPHSGAPERWLDLASGTGIAARRLLKKLPTGSLVIAGDLVASMLERAREASPRIPVVRLDAARLP